MPIVPKVTAVLTTREIVVPAPMENVAPAPKVNAVHGLMVNAANVVMIIKEVMANAVLKTVVPSMENVVEAEVAETSMMAVNVVHALKANVALVKKVIIALLVLKVNAVPVKMVMSLPSNMKKDMMVKTLLYFKNTTINLLSFQLIVVQLDVAAVVLVVEATVGTVLVVPTAPMLSRRTVLAKETGELQKMNSRVKLNLSLKQMKVKNPSVMKTLTRMIRALKLKRKKKRSPLALPLVNGRKRTSILKLKASTYANLKTLRSSTWLP